MNVFLKPDTADQIEDTDPVASWLRLMKDYASCDVILPKSD
ncbi:MAG: hypothetical protein ACREP0_03010 [Rhodanobacteraceae bacterium]